jgi:hypothetical protein
MAEISVTPGGLAVDAEGKPADMPRELVHSLNSQLFDVLTLLYVAREEVPEGGEKDDDDLTCQSGRAVSLIHMAEEKARAAIMTISPYV